MPHVTFVHGISNKPPKQDLLRNWEDALAEGGLDLGSKGVTTSMVYWADVMYAEPESVDAQFESVEEGLGTADQDEDLAWTDKLEGDEDAFVKSMRGKLRFDEPSPEGDGFEPPATPGDEAAFTDEELKFEAIPLPWFIKRRVMKALLRDVHHYLFNSNHSPRPGEEYQVKDHIRKLFVEQIEEDSENNPGGPHVVVSHSMGTVIAYDCLKNDPRCKEVSGLMTVGSPLGLSEVHDNLKPGYSQEDGYPSQRVPGSWYNVFDRLDPVAFDTHLANDYQKGGRKIVIDDQVHNSGRWRHSGWKYFGQPALCNHLKTLLEL
jgi:predicted alpha/beta hydrolase family esterase